MSFTQPLDAQRALNCGDETARSLMLLWESERGRDSMKFVPVSENIIRFSGRLEAGLAPKVLTCGVKTLAANLVGPEVAQQPPDVLNEALGEGYRRFAYSIYHEALENLEPAYDLVSSIFETDGKAYELIYNRLVLPIHTTARPMGGPPTLIRQAILYTIPHHKRLIRHLSDPRDPLAGSPPATDPTAAFLDRRPGQQAGASTA